MVANKDFQQAANKALMLQAVLDGRADTRASLARELGMYRSTVSNLSEVLLAEKWLLEVGAAKTEGAGRKGTVLAINPERGMTAGIALRGRGDFEAVLLDTTGEVLTSERGRVDDMGDSGNEALRRTLEAALIHCVGRAAMANLPLLGAGVAISGPVDASRQRIVLSQAFDLQDADFTGFVDDTGFPVFVENDSQSCAWGRAWRSGNRGDEDFAYLYMNRQTGTSQDVAFGLGLFLDGRAYHGAHRYAGEMPGRFAREVDRRLGGKVVQMIGKLMQADRPSRRIIAELADSLLDMIQFLDPHKVYLGHHMEPFRDMIDEYLEGKRRDILFDVEFAELGEYEVAFGAGCYMLNHLYSIPRAGGSKGWSLN